MNDVARPFTFRELFEVVLTRDTWMHRLDTSRASGIDFEMTPEHDGRIVADAVRDWAAGHGHPFRLLLTGPAGGGFRRGQAADALCMDALEFARLLIRPFWGRRSPRDPDRLLTSVPAAWFVPIPRRDSIHSHRCPSITARGATSRSKNLRGVSRKESRVLQFRDSRSHEATGCWGSTRTSEPPCPSADEVPVRSGPDAGGQLWLIVGGEDLRRQLSPASHSRLVEDRLEMLLDR